MPWLHNKDSLEINSLNSRQEKAKTIVSNNKRISVKLKFFPSFKGGKKSYNIETTYLLIWGGKDLYPSLRKYKNSSRENYSFKGS
jgi:hypothetical protein